MRRALFMGAPAPVELSDYQTARAFWREIGIRYSDDVLDNWPEERIRRYMIVMHQVDVWEDAQMELARRKAAASSTPGRGA